MTEVVRLASGTWWMLLGVTSACASQRETIAWPVAQPPRAVGQAVDAPAPAGGQGGPLGSTEPLVPQLPIEALGPGVDAPDAETSLAFVWPLEAHGITSLYGPRQDPMGKGRRFHAGVDMDAAYGEVVRAAAAGKVVYAGRLAGHGRHVIIEHAGGYRTSYSHLAQLLVFGGEHVRAGQPLGQLGTSGRSTGPHLHFEVLRHGQPLDPLDFLGYAVSIAAE